MGVFIRNDMDTKLYEAHVHSVKKFNRLHERFVHLRHRVRRAEACNDWKRLDRFYEEYVVAEQEMLKYREENEEFMFMLFSSDKKYIY